MKGSDASPFASNKNSAVERAYFDRFRRVYDLPNGVVEFGDRPDVIVRGLTTTGIELTRLHLRDGQLLASEQRQRPLRDAIVAQAQALFMAAGGPRVEWHVGFRAGSLARSTAKGLARRLADFALASDPSVSGEIPRDSYEASIAEVRFLYVNRKEYDDARWRVSQVHSVGLISPAAVQAVIDEKERKARLYERCDAYWLLIVVEPMDPAQEQEIRLEGLVARSDFFERVIIYKPTFEHVVEVRVR